MVAVQELGFCSIGRVFVFQPNPGQIRIDKKNSKSMNLRFAFLPLREAQNKPEWKLMRRNVMFSTGRPGSLYSQFGCIFGKILESSVLYQIKKEKILQQQPKTYFASRVLMGL